MALPPQMEEPTPIKTAVLESICVALNMMKETISDVAMVEMITGKETQPTCNTCVMLRPKPRRITAHCRIFLDVNPMPAPVFSRFQDVNKEPIIMPRIMAKIGLPIK